MEQGIKAKIVSMEQGLQEYDNIEMIRVKSRQHTLLVMKNYMPVLGRLDGFLELVFEDHTIRIPNIQGYYMHKKNVFSLLVEAGDAIPVEVSEETEDV